MKNLIVFAMVAAALTIFNGCQKDELGVSQMADDVQPQKVVQPDVYVEDGYLAFKNIEAVDSIIYILKKMTTSEKESWENQMGFRSARADFEALFEKYEKLPTYEAFLSFKQSNRNKLKFNEIDPNDCSIDYPYATGYFIPVLNNKGLVKIGESLIKYTKNEQIVIKDGNIKALDNLDENVKQGNVFVYPKLNMKSSAYDYEERDLIHDFPEDYPFDPFVYTPWHKKTSSRKLKNELRIDRYRNYEYNYITSQYDWVRGYRIYFKQQAQKTNWLGRWVDYTTTYTYDDVKLKVGSEPIFEFNPTIPPVSQEVNPHAELDLYGYDYREPAIPNYVPPLLTAPNVSISILTSCRGFDGELYRVDHFEHSNFPGTGVPFNPTPSY